MANPSYRRILVPVDFSLCSRQAFEHARYIAGLVGASIDVLYVWSVPTYVDHDLRVHTPEMGPRSVIEFARERAKEDMEAFLEGLDGSVAVKGQIEHGNPVEVIVEHSKASCDLIVMGTHGHTGLNHLLMGSVAEVVVRLAACPVLTIRQASAPGARA